MKSSLEDLKIYQLAERIEIFLYKLTEKFLIDEKYRMVDQVRRASNAITSNIAKGYGRYHYQEKIRYIHISRGESYEVKQLIKRSYKKGFIKKETATFLDEKMTDLIKGLNGYIRYLRSRKD